MGDITTMTVFEFTRLQKLWAFAAMSLVGRRLRRVSGIRFRKMMGSGKGIGFSARPDFGRYALLATWSSRAEAEEFYRDSRFMYVYRRRATSIRTWYLLPHRSHGAWDGSDPFAREERDAGDPEQKLAVITRATINLRRARPFWKMVRPVADELAKTEGLSYSIGVGEVPWIRQATFSVWSSASAMKQFAYSSPLHREVIRRTREEEWYAEDLFARFSILEELEERA